MLSRALLLTQATTALVGALLVVSPQVGHDPQQSTPAAVAVSPVTAPVGAAAVPAAPRARPPLPRQLPRRSTAVKPAARTSPRPARRPATTVRPAVVRPMARSPRQAMDAAVRRLPGYRAGSTTWVLSSAYGSWGTADWYNNRVYISPRVPQRKMYDVVAHEWSHLLSVRPYGGDVNAAIAAMNSWFGGSGFTGAERAADCMARQLGAQWTHYTSCEQTHWQTGARTLLSGRQLPTSSS